MKIVRFQRYYTKNMEKMKGAMPILAQVLGGKKSKNKEAVALSRFSDIFAFTNTCYAQDMADERLMQQPSLLNLNAIPLKRTDNEH